MNISEILELNEPAREDGKSFPRTRQLFNQIQSEMGRHFISIVGSIRSFWLIRILYVFMVIFESKVEKIILFTAKITFYSLLLATKKALVRNRGCSQKKLIYHWPLNGGCLFFTSIFHKICLFNHCLPLSLLANSFPWQTDVWMSLLRSIIQHNM